MNVRRRVEAREMSAPVLWYYIIYGDGRLSSENYVSNVIVFLSVPAKCRLKRVVVWRCVWHNETMFLLRRNALLIILLILISACRQAVTETPTPPTPTTSVATPTAPITATPQPTRTSPPAPTTAPTPFIPHMGVNDQVLTDEGQLTVASVMSPEPGWLVIYTMPGEELGEILGYTAVQIGNNTNLIININPLSATPTLAAVLHVDQGNVDEFEFPDGPDVPLMFESGIIAQTFQPQFELSLPIITVNDQEILEDGLVHLEKVVALTPGWLVIQADDNGQPGEYLGSAPLTAGANDHLTIHIPWQQGTNILHALIYADNGNAHQLELPDVDVPFQVNGQPVVASFRASYPPDLYVLDQPIIDGTIEVERVTSKGPGWLVVYYDDGGQPGLIIGYAALEDGVNERVVVRVLHTAVTNPLHIRLHEDTVPGDAFDFPRVDPPIVYEGRQWLPYSFNTEPGSYIMTLDQSPQETAAARWQIIIPYSIVEEPAWVALHADANGSPGDILGVSSLRAGLNRDIVVEFDLAAATDTLHAALYTDSGEAGVFEFPGGADTPIQRNRRILSAPFRLLGN